VLQQVLLVLRRYRMSHLSFEGASCRKQELLVLRRVLLVLLRHYQTTPLVLMLASWGELLVRRVLLAPRRHYRMTHLSLAFWQPLVLLGVQRALPVLRRHYQMNQPSLLGVSWTQVQPVPQRVLRVLRRHYPMTQPSLAGVSWPKPVLLVLQVWLAPRHYRSHFVQV
jgi:hypothetical protein